MLKKEVIESNWELFKNMLLNTKRENIDKLIEYLESTDFNVSPASSQYHHAYLGGLVEHSLAVYYNCIELNKSMKFDITSEQMVISCLLHDLCKANSYSMSKRNKKDENGKWIEVDFFVNDDKWPIGHAEKSVIIAQMFIKLDSMEVSLIMGHMGSFENRDKQYTSLATKYPEVILMHTADMLNAKGIVLKNE